MHKRSFLLPLNTHIGFYCHLFFYGLFGPWCEQNIRFSSSRSLRFNSILRMVELGKCVLIRTHAIIRDYFVFLYISFNRDLVNRIGEFYAIQFFCFVIRLDLYLKPFFYIKYEKIRENLINTQNVCKFVISETNRRMVDSFFFLTKV